MIRLAFCSFVCVFFTTYFLYSEFIAQESNEQFWNLVDSIVDLPYSSYSDRKFFNAFFIYA